MNKKSTLELAKKKSEREQRIILVHKSENTYFITPEEKAGDQVSDLELVERFEPEGDNDENYERLPVMDFSSLEEGARVLTNEENVHIITEVTSRQIVTNVGDKFRRSDGKEWGGGDKRIQNKLKKVS
jgi:hypothetical protein